MRWSWISLQESEVGGDQQVIYLCIRKKNWSSMYEEVPSINKGEKENQENYTNSLLAINILSNQRGQEST